MQLRYTISDRKTGLARNEKCDGGTTFAQVLETEFDSADLNKMTIRVSRGGANFTPAANECVQEGDRIKVVPEKVDNGS